MGLTEICEQARRTSIASRLLVLAAMTVPLAIYACDDSTSSPPLDYTALLQNLTEDTSAPTTTGFATQADALAASLKTLETSADATTLAAAQTQWRAARHAFRLLDAVHYGPTTELRTEERVDTFPADTAAIAALAAAPPANLDGAVGGAKGFLALETLLFSADGDDAALTALDANRRTVARLMGEDIAAAAHQLADAWTTGGYAAQLKTAGNGSPRYATQRAALDDLVGAVGFAFETVVAVSLANPLGRQNAGRPDQKLVIASISDNTVTDMVSTLEGIRATYDGRGFTTLVRARSAPLDDTFHTQLADCTTKLKALPPPFSRAIIYQTAAVLDAYNACKTVKGTWNAEVTSALGATVKPTDNDGD